MDSLQNNDKRVVLIIDSDRAKAEELKDILIGNGYLAYTAGTLKKIFELVAKENVALALLSLERLSLDPNKLITSLKRGKSGKKIPVIVILENFVEDIVASAFKAGAVDYLTHPIDIQELIRRTGVHARIQEAERDKSGILARLSHIFPSLVRDTELLGNRYAMISRLGIGSFGEVWKVRDVKGDTDEVFVAKIPLSKKLNAKFEKEARILGRLTGHIGVPEVREVIEVDNKSVLIQEFVHGKTLYEIIEKELDKKEVESVVIQLTNVVAYAHGLEIMHRDIKPGNVMVKPDGTLKLLDFGAAKELIEKDYSDTVTGSQPYMSPEQIMGKSQRSSDVWALGVILYLLYTGMFPFYHKVEKVLMDMILDLPPSPPSEFKKELDPEIERIILKCLEKNPEKRYPEAGALKKDIIDTFPDYGKRILPLY
jgi:CheY-like chemotaxis protein